MKKLVESVEELVAQGEAQKEKIAELENIIAKKDEKVEEIEMEKNEYSIKVLIDQFAALSLSAWVTKSSNQICIFYLFKKIYSSVYFRDNNLSEKSYQKMS